MSKLKYHDAEAGLDLSHSLPNGKLAFKINIYVQGLQQVLLYLHLEWPADKTNLQWITKISGPFKKIKMPSYQYRFPHYKDKMVSWPSVQDCSNSIGT